MREFSLALDARPTEVTAIAIAFHEGFRRMGRHEDFPGFVKSAANILAPVHWDLGHVDEHYQAIVIVDSITAESPVAQAKLELAPPSGRRPGPDMIGLTGADPRYRPPRRTASRADRVAHRGRRATADHGCRRPYLRAVAGRPGRLSRCAAKPGEQ